MNLLRVFNAVVRHSSFKMAAAELYVTPAAISHQIRVIEEELGTQLFRRLNRKIELTETGKSYYQQINPALSTITAATQTDGSLSGYVNTSFTLERFVLNRAEQLMRIKGQVLNR